MSDSPAGDGLAGGISRRRQTAAGLLVIVLFAAGMLQFAGLDWRAPPPESRVNDGRQATFFALHIYPYGVFSEDFHLYAVRAKRIRDRGWSDSLLDRREGAGTNIVAPVQVLIGRLAVATDGDPFRYACFLMALLTVAWSGMYLAVRRWLPREISWGVALVAVLVTVQWEAAEYFFRTPPYSELQWPAHRGLRVATNAWTNPLFAAVLLLVSSVPFSDRLPLRKCAGLAVMLGILAGADNWAFAVAWLSCGWLLAGLAALGLIRWRAKQQTLAGSLARPFILAITLGATWLLHKLMTAAVTGDVALRSGVGPDWLHEVTKINLWEHGVQYWGNPGGWWTVAAIGGLSGVVYWPGRRAAPGSAAGQRFTAQLLVVAALPLLAMLTLLPVLRHSGMELYLANQVYWRVNYALLLVLMLLAGEALHRVVLWQGWWQRRPAGTAARTWSMIVVLGISGLFLIHQLKIERFIRKVASREFFLTAEAEQFRDWLQDYERRKGAFSLATASHELNYLCAYWTDADLLLPEGFPYHNAADNEDIRRRVVNLLRVYGATPESWRKFARPGEGRFQQDWRESRTVSEQEGFLYYVYHRAAQLKSQEHPEWAKEERERIAERLTATGEAVPQPDVIVIDGAAQLLGQAQLDDYALAFEHGELTAWVRKGDPAVRPPNAN